MKCSSPDFGDLEPSNGRQDILPQIMSDEVVDSFGVAAGNVNARQADVFSTLTSEGLKMNLIDG